jgi:hypothetical protein
VRSILKDTFPSATTLADYAALSSLQLGTYPRHPYATASVTPFKNDEPEAEMDKDAQALMDGKITDDTVGTTPKIQLPKKIRPSMVLLPSRVVFLRLLAKMLYFLIIMNFALLVRGSVRSNILHFLLQQ